VKIKAQGSASSSHTPKEKSDAMMTEKEKNSIEL
jgi:hypothetical protein